MKDFRYEELKEIRRGLGVLFLVVLTYFGDVLRKYFEEGKDLILLKISGFVLIFISILILVITVMIALIIRRTKDD